VSHKSKSPSHAEEDRKRVEKVDTVNKAENLAFSVEKQLGELGDKAPADLKSSLEEKVKAVRDAITSDDVDKIKSATADLEGQLQALAAAAQQAGASMGGNPDVEPAEPSESSEPKKAKGKVVDAEVVD